MFSVIAIFYYLVLFFTSIAHCSLLPYLSLMPSLEIKLASKLFAQKKISNISNAKFVIDEEKQDVYLVFTLLENGKEKLYKSKINHLLHSYKGDVKEMLTALIATEMMFLGYYLVPIDGGYMCVGGDELYSLRNNECTCRDFITNRKNKGEKCKHLYLLDYMYFQRRLVTEWQLQNN